MQEIVTGIATVHPELVLDHLAELARGDDTPLMTFTTLGFAFDQQSETLAKWVQTTSTRTRPPPATS